VIVEIVSGEGQQVIGVMVDAVNAVLDISSADIEPAPSFGARIRTDFIQGMAKTNGKFVILLDVDHVLSMDELDGLVQLNDGFQRQPLPAPSSAG
jgi:purine-binding chemotaxis protein CheW